MRRFLVSCALMAAAGTVAGSRQSTLDRPRTALLIDAVAADRNGAPVLDLKPEDVEVWIGHFRVPIDTFTPITPASDERGGRIIVLLLDDVTVPLPLMARVKEVARRFVTRMAPGDQMAIVTLNGTEMESTADRARLLQRIDRYTVRLSGVTRPELLGEHVLKTVTTLSRQLVEAGEQRKTIVGIGSAWLLDRPLPPPAAGHDLLPEWIEAMRTLSRSNVNYYAIDPAGVGSTRVDGGDAGFARETGGIAFVNTNDLTGAADRIMREAANYYLIGVGSPPVGGGGLRELDVRSLRRGVTIRARRAIH